MEARKPRLLQALNELYGTSDGPHCAERGASDVVQDFSPVAEPGPKGVEGARVPWLSGPEDSWL